MKKLFSLILTLALGCALLASCGTPASESLAQSSPANDTPASSASAQPVTDAVTGTLSLGGSTSVEKVVQAMMEAYMAENPGVTITYAPTGSGAGIQGATDGSLDIGLSSRELKDDEKTGLTATTIALDGIAVIVNTENTVTDLSMDELAAIFKGEITDWSEVGGMAGEIVVIGRDAASGTRDGFESIVGVEEECAYAEEQASTGAVSASVQANAGAIGYVSVSAVREDIKALTIDGIAATEETVKDGSYAIQRPFMFVINDSAQNEVAAAFIEWAVSDKTVELVANAGAVPVA